MRNYETRMKNRIARLKIQFPDKAAELDAIPRNELIVIARQSADYIARYFLRLLELDALPEDFWL